MPKSSSIIIKSPAEIAVLREAGHVLAEIMEELKRSLKSGMTTQEVDSYAEALILARRVIPAFKGYRGFPGCICISVNEEVVHGIPGEKKICEGDIVSLDCGIVHEGYYSDTAVTVPVGEIKPEIKDLLKVTEESLHAGIEQARAGNHLSDISHAIEKYVQPHGFGIVKQFVGHGIGKNLHEDPEIPNFGPPHQGPVVEEGMVFAIEPMVNLGTWQTQILSDGWTVVTKDEKPSAHFEHTVAVTKNGPEVLTKLN